MTECDLIVKNAKIIVMDEQNTILTKAAVAINEDLISAIGSTKALTSNFRASRQIDAAGKGQIFLKNGELFAAKTESKEGEEAIYELVTFDEGLFDFEISDEEVERNINNSTMNVIMEACRIMDENRSQDS